MVYKRLRGIAGYGPQGGTSPYNFPPRKSHAELFDICLEEKSTNSYIFSTIFGAHLMVSKGNMAFKQLNAFPKR